MPPQYPTPTIFEIIDTHTDAIDFLHRWMRDNAPVEVARLFADTQTLWCVELGHFKTGQMPPEGFDLREVIGAVFSAKALLCELDTELEVGDE